MISTQLRNQQRVKINTEVLKAFTNQSFSQKLLETSILKCFGAFSRQIVLQPSGVGQVFSNHGEQQADATNQTFFSFTQSILDISRCSFFFFAFQHEKQFQIFSWRVAA